MHARLTVLAAALVLAACAQYGAGLVPGRSSAAEVEAQLGEPTAVKQIAGGDTLLWYSKLPYGRESYAARVDRNGILVSFEQRLTEANIAKLKPNASTAEELFDLLGPPLERWKYPLKDLEAWSYPLRTGPEAETLFVDVSPDGIVRSVYKLHDRDRRHGFFFGW